MFAIVIKDNSYLAIARRALIGVKAMYGIGAENEFSANAQKVAERYMKAVIEMSPSPETKLNVMRTHSLRVLYSNLNHLNYLGISKRDINNLNGYHFEASYPGDDFILVTPEIEKECYTALMNIVNKVELFISNNSEETNEF